VVFTDAIYEYVDDIVIFDDGYVYGLCCIQNCIPYICFLVCHINQRWQAVRKR
jgi:hypothetical protein